MEQGVALLLIDQLREALGTPRFMLSVGGDPQKARELIDQAYTAFRKEWDARS
jgi:hypothetical protein